MLCAATPVYVKVLLFFLLALHFSTEENIFICAYYQLTHVSVPSLMCRVSVAAVYRVKKGVGMFQFPFKNGNKTVDVIQYFFPAVSKGYHL